MTAFISADDPNYGDRARALVRIGQVGIATEDNDALDAYFGEGFKFHGPGGDATYSELKAFFASMRAAFTDYRCERSEIIRDGNFIGARTTMSGTFTSRFEASPVGPLEPNGKHVSFDLVNMFRYNDAGELVEEWVQYDTLDFVRQLGVEVASATTLKGA